MTTSRVAPVWLALLFGLAAGCSPEHEVRECADDELARCACAGSRGEWDRFGRQSCLHGAFGECVCGFFGAPLPCDPGARAACRCGSGATGAQECSDDGAFGACACGGEAALCIPGASVSCACTSGDRGAQSCRSDGHFGECVCSTTSACRTGEWAACFCADGARGTQVCRSDGAYDACDCGGALPPGDAGWSHDAGPRDAGRRDGSVEWSYPNDGALPRDAGPTPDGGPCGTCESLGARCGTVRDLCGGGLDCGACSVEHLRVIELPANDIVSDRARDLLYVTTSSAGGILGNSVVAIDAATGNVAWSVVVGSEPGPIALSDDGSTLWIGLDGSGAVRSVDTVTHAVGPEHTLGVARWGDALFAGQIEVMPGAPRSIAVSARDAPRDLHGYAELVAIYDDGVRRATTSQDATGITFGRIDQIAIASQTTLFGYTDSNTGYQFYRMTLGVSGVVSVTEHDGLLAGFDTHIIYEGGMILSSNGTAVDPIAPRRLGTYATGGGQFNSVASEGAANRVYFTRSTTFGSTGPVELVGFDRATFTETGRVALTGVSGTARRLVRFGLDGLAYVTRSETRFGAEAPARIVLVRTNLVAIPR